MSQLFESGGQSIEVAASTSVLPMNTQDWCPLGWTDWISLQFKGLSRVFSNTIVQKASILRHSAFFIVQFSHPYMTTGKTIALTRQTFVDKGMSLLFNMLSRLVINFLPRSKHLLISWLQSPSEVILEPPKIKSATVYMYSRKLEKWTGPRYEKENCGLSHNRCPLHYLYFATIRIVTAFVKRVTFNFKYSEVDLALSRWRKFFLLFISQMR